MLGEKLEFEEYNKPKLTENTNVLTQFDNFLPKDQIEKEGKNREQ